MLHHLESRLKKVSFKLYYVNNKMAEEYSLINKLNIQCSNRTTLEN